MQMTRTTAEGSIEVIQQLRDCFTAQSEEVVQRLDQVARLLSACHETSGPLKDVPEEGLSRDVRGSVEVC